MHNVIITNALIGVQQYDYSHTLCLYTLSLSPSLTHTHTHLAGLSLQHVFQSAPDPEPSAAGGSAGAWSHLLPLSPPSKEWSCEELLHLSDGGRVVDNVQRFGMNTEPGVTSEPRSE